MPVGIGRALWFDLSPMRPDEWFAQEAGPWFRAEAIQGVYRKGRDQAEAEYRKQDEYRVREQKALETLRNQG